MTDPARGDSVPLEVRFEQAKSVFSSELTQGIERHLKDSDNFTEEMLAREVAPSFAELLRLCKGDSKLFNNALLELDEALDASSVDRDTCVAIRDYVKSEVLEAVFVGTKE